MKIEIPKILHYIWISGKKKDIKDVPISFYQNFLKSLELVENENNDWKIKIWTNKEIDATPNLKKIYELNRDEVEIININTPGSIFNQDLQNKISSELTVKQKNIYLKSFHLAIRIDILKYQILKEEGGVINDWNFRYERLPNNEELSKYDLMLYKFHKTKHFKDAMIENSFMAAAPNHPFIKEIQSDILPKAKEYKFCLDADPKFPQELESYMKTILKSGNYASLDILKQSFCSTQITTDHLSDIDISAFPNVAVSSVYKETCLNEPCLGYDYFLTGKQEIIQSWAEG